MPPGNDKSACWRKVLQQIRLRKSRCRPPCFPCFLVIPTKMRAINSQENGKDPSRLETCVLPAREDPSTSWGRFPFLKGKFKSFKWSKYCKREKGGGGVLPLCIRLIEWYSIWQGSAADTQNLSQVGRKVQKQRESRSKAEMVTKGRGSEPEPRRMNLKF